jgi:general secretion pathway protein L
MKMSIYEIGSNFLKISTSSHAKNNQFFEETEKLVYQHGLTIHDNDFLKETINEINQIHRELDIPGKLIVILPFFLTTSRTINLPVAARNKINMMLPFQLDDSLPGGSQSMHWVDHVYKRDKKSSNICLSLVNRELFENIYQQFKDIGLYPSLVTSELSIYLQLIETFKKPKYSPIPLTPPLPNGNFVIMDMGEKQTTAYFFSNGQLVFNHYSNIGSSNIDENIADNYDLSIEEAKLFKEENGFLFTTNDYENADQDQQIFAQLMEKTLEPLILDFAKWDLAFRSKTSNAIERCYIVGGMSKMQNINNFLNEQLEVETENLILNNFSRSIDYTEYFSHQALNIISMKSGKVANFLKDKFKLSSNSSSVSDNSAFFAGKTIILSTVLLLFLSVERVFIEINKDDANKALKKTLKSKVLNIGKRDQVSYRRNHKKLKNLIAPRLEKINKNQKILTKSAELPYTELINHINDIKILKYIKLQKISLFEKSVASLVKINLSENRKETIAKLRSKFGKSVNKVDQNQYEILIRE